MNGAMQVVELKMMSLHDFVNMLITFPIEDALLSVEYKFELIELISSV